MRVKVATPPHVFANISTKGVFKMGKLTGKVVVVTGAVSVIPGFDSIGSATVREALAEGAEGVVISDINDELGEVFAKTLNEEYGAGHALYVHTDVSNPKDVEQLFEITENTYGRVDAIMANAGVATAEDFDKDPEAVLKSKKFIQSINEDGVFNTALYGSRLMMKHGTKGSIVLVSSIHGVAGRPKVVNAETGEVLIERFNLIQYTMGKHGVVGLSKALALQFAEYGIRVNTVNPGYIMTPLFQAAVTTDKEKLSHEKTLETDAFDFTQLAALHPLCNDPVKDADIVPRGKFGGRMGVPAEIAKPAVFLMSDDASFITGQKLVIDGGYTAS
jgi:NAD(P)-dependent dehydrogenase (short-subunit alcohol dehydrogenase family)